MKRRLKKILIIILILILTIGIFNYAKKVLIRNIFDEMYFGTKEIWGGHITSTSWNNMSGLAKTIDSVKYAVPDTIYLGFSKHILSDDENFQVVWEIDKKRILFIYSVSLPNLDSAVSAILNVYYYPYQKRLEVYPLHVASSNSIYGDTSREAINGYLKMYRTSETALYARVSEVFETALIENWRTGNPTTLFQDALGEFETVYVEGAYKFLEN